MTSPARPDDRPATESDVTPAPSGPTYVQSVPPIIIPDLSGPFGRYDVLRRLGKGGMGCVYLARDTQLDRLVALKVPQFEAGDHDMLRERFYREARAAANLRHPNICPVHDVGAVGDVPYLTMAYIDGTPLNEWAAARPLAEILIVVRKIALALDEAHQRGVLHRDLKPSNVLIDERVEPIVMDFGLARRLQVEEKDRLTSPGLIVGTPGYMAPEQALGQPDAAGPASDVYSLGVILYELIAGVPPFTGPALIVLTKVIRDTPPPPSHHRPGLGSRFDGFCLRALARLPGQRFASMADFAAALPCLDDTTLPARSLRSPLPTPPTRWDNAVAARALDLLRRWGWSRAVQKMRGRAQSSDSENDRNGFQSLLDWLSSEDGGLARAGDQSPLDRVLRGWALAGHASRLLRDRLFGDALRALDRARAEGPDDDPALAATIAHTHGAALVHLGRCDDALPFLHQALELFGREHFMAGRVLDTLGTAYASRGNFPIAREFYEQSLRFKERFDDEAGIAVSHGQLGRLYLDWGELDEAEEHFQRDLELAQRIRSRFSEAQICNHLGQVALARGEREAAAGRRAAMRRHFAVAAGWLTQSIELASAGKHTVAEGFARKDMALLALAEGDLDRAGEQATTARALFGTANFQEGIAKIQLVIGMVLRERGNFAEAEHRLREALAFFEKTNDADDAVRVHWELARAQRDRKALPALVSQAYQHALSRAEALRHDPLVRAIERELHDVDPEGYLRHIYCRARGWCIDDDDPSLMDGATESATVLFVDMPGFNEFSVGMTPQAVLLTFNHLVADFADVLERHRGRVVAYRGNGLMALMRDGRHAERAVSAALDLVAALEAFNRPRQVLGLAVFHARIGIASGEVLLGNVGTYHKMDFTAIGTAVSVAGALRNEARFGQPCVSRATYEGVRGRFACGSDTPRVVQVAGYGAVDVWDVCGRR